MSKAKNIILFLLKLIMLVAWSTGCFFFGARYFETGRIPNFLQSEFGGQTYTGGTILISGTCSLKSDKTKKKGLLRDQLTVFKDDGKILQGVVRKDKTFVDCDRNSISIDTMPLLVNIFKYKLIEVPSDDIIFEEIKKETPRKDWSFLEKRTVLMSGTNCTDYKKEPVPNFIENEVIILKATDLGRENAKLDLIRKKDQFSLVCEYKNISITDKKEIKKEEIKTVMNQVVYVSGRCLSHKTNISNLPVKLSNYVLKETPIRVISEKIIKNKIVSVSGVILEENNPILSIQREGKEIPLPIKGHVVECNNSIENPISVIENPILIEKEGE